MSCLVQNVCGNRLEKGVVIVGTATFTISVVALATSFLCLKFMKISSYNSDPVAAVNLVVGLFCISMSLYQCIVASLLLWYSLKRKDNRFVCSLWYVSHLSILTLYFMMFCAKVVIEISCEYYTSALLTFIGWLLYMCLFSFFMVVIYSYMLKNDSLPYQIDHRI